jgi:hypothetical protein
MGEINLNMFENHVPSAWLGVGRCGSEPTRVKGTGGVARHHHHCCSPIMRVTTHDVLCRVGVHARRRGAML